MTHSIWPARTFLGQLRDDSLKIVLSLGALTAYPAHRTVLHQGDESRHVVLLTRGVVKVVTRSENGYDMLTAIRVAGDLVGEMAAFEDQPRSGTVIAASDVSARVIQQHQLESFLVSHPDAMRAVFRMLSARLRWANERRLDFRAYGHATRFARVLAELTRAYGSPVPGPPSRRHVVGVTVTQAELASLAGIGLTTAEKALAELARRGIVERDYRMITVNDLTALLKIAELRA